MHATQRADAPPSPPPQPPRDWVRHAACRGAPLHWFITASCDDDADCEPPEPQLPPPAAEACCQRCPVRTDCLQWALAQDEELVGVWGGTTSYQRRQMLRVRARVKCVRCGSTKLERLPTGQVCLACGTAWYAAVAGG